MANLTFRIQKCLIQVQSHVKSRYHYAKKLVSWVSDFKFCLQFFLHNGTCILPEICQKGVQNVKLGKIWHPHFNGLKKTYLEPKFHIHNLKNKKSGQQSSYQKIWKILLLLHTQSIVCATIDSQCLEYLGCITLSPQQMRMQSKSPNSIKLLHSTDPLLSKVKSRIRYFRPLSGGL